MNKEESLKFGQTVSISPLENQNLCIYSDGLVKTRAKLIEITPETLACGSLFYQSLFRIYPMFVTSKLSDAVNFENKKIDDGQKKMKEIKELQKRIIVDYKKNIEDSQKAKDKPLSFNDPIQFLHIATNKFLSCQFGEAKQEKENFKLELVQYPSSRTTFKLQPAFAHQFQSEAQIYAGDSMYITCQHVYIGMIPQLRAVMPCTQQMDNSRYLNDRSLYAVPNLKLLKRMTDQMHTQREGMEQSDVIAKLQRAVFKSTQLKRDRTLRSLGNVPSEMKNNGMVTEVNVSLEQKSAWVINTFCNQNDLEQIISFNDIIWVHHIEENSLVSVTRNQDDELIITFMKQNEGQQEFDGNSNGMFQIENEDMLKGGLLEWGQNLRLRHFILGKYLAVNVETIVAKNAQQLLYLTDKPSENTLFQFLPVPSLVTNAQTQKYVTKDAFMKIRFTVKDQWVHIESKKVLQVNTKMKNVVQEEDICILVARLTDKAEDDDVLKLYKANYSDVVEANFLVTCFPVLRKSLTFLRAPVQEKYPKIIQHLSDSIMKLEAFSNNKLINTSLDIKNTRVVILKRQKILREQYFIDILIEIMKNLTNETELKQYREYQIEQHKLELQKKDSVNHDKKQMMDLNVSKSSQSVVHTKSLMSVSSTIVAKNSLLSHMHSHKHASHQSQKHKQHMEHLNTKMNVLKLIYRLLRSICQDNQENQIYVYKRFQNFIYQIRYFKEATDFIITVVTGNEQVLVNLCDDIKLNEKLERKNMKINQSDSEESDMEIKFNTLEDKGNNILILYKFLTEDSEGLRNIQYIDFFRAICKLNGSSISVNQEMIFKFMKQSEKFKQCLFMPIIIEDTKMKIIVSPQEISYLKSIKDPQIQQYLINQLFLYSDLAFQRNFLWKSYIGQIFSPKFIFMQIFDTDNTIEYRSAFCNMALTVYVDHEPFNQVIAPNMCRLYKDETTKSKNDKSSTRQNAVAQQYRELITTTFDYLDKIGKEIDTYLEKKANIKRQQQEEETQSVTNQLILDIVRLISIMIRFDMLRILQEDSRYQMIVPQLIKLLEYNRSNLLYPYILKSVREDNIKTASQKTSMAVVIPGAASALLNVGKQLASSILGIPPKQQESLEDEFSEFDTQVIARNPIVGSLISISDHLDHLAGSPEIQTQKSTFQECDIQIEICNILLFFQDQRQDFYISNFIAYYKIRAETYKYYNEDTKFKETYMKDLETGIVQVLPPLLKTGITSLDQEAVKELNKKEEDDNILNLAKLNIIDSGEKFMKLTQTPEIPNLDKLLAGGSSVQTYLLPSVIITFYISNDFGLTNKLIELMRRCFSQTEELYTNLNKIELLFKDQEIQCYKYLDSEVKELKILTECSEVWLVDFLASPSGQIKEIQKIEKLLKDITLLLREGTSIDHKARVVPGPTNKISPQRQKIFNFLNVHVPLVNFLRDTQQQFVKVLDDAFYSDMTKDVVKSLLQDLFVCLKDFCYLNNENQNLIHRHQVLILDELQHDYGQMDLLSNIYQDNKALCTRVSITLLQKILGFVYRYGRQPRFIQFFKYIQTYRNNPLTEIQALIMSLFIPQHIGVEDYIDINEFNLYGEFSVVGGHKTVEFSFKKAEKLFDQPYYYHSEILQVFLKAVIGEESFKINGPKLKKLFRLPYLLSLLLIEDDMLNEENNILDGLNIDLDPFTGIKYLKPQLIELINILYVNNKVIDLFLFIKEQSTFTQLFNIEKNKLLKLQLMKGSFVEYINYFFDHMIVLMRYYSEKVIGKDLSSEFLDREDYKALKEIMIILMEMCQNILEQKLQPVQYNHLIKFCLSIDQQIFNQYKGTFSMSLTQEEVLKPMQEETIFTQKHNINDPLIDKGADTSKKVKKSKKDKTEDQGPPFNWDNKESWNMFLNQSHNAKRVRKQIGIELRMLTNAFLEGKQFIPEPIYKELQLTLQFEDLLKKLIRFIEVGVINQADKSNLIFTLKLLQDILLSAEENDQLEKMQNTFDSCQATRMFLNLLADFQSIPFDDDLLLELFKFAHKLSNEGNQKVQATVYHYLSNFEKSELIFLKWFQIIYEVINDNKAKDKLKEKKKETKDNHQIYQQQQYLAQEVHNEDNDVQAQQEANEARKIKIDILIHLLEYLQLLCEGHNNLIQNYLRQQFNSRNNYNIVQAMVELLCVFQKDLQRDSFNIVMNTLETLTELVQGPCSQNQQDIIDSQFLEVASSYLNMQIDQKKKKKGQNDDDGEGSQKESEFEKSNSLVSGSKKSANRTGQVKIPQLERWMLERLKYKCMILVSSLLELNSDKLAIKRILRSLPINVLRKNLIFTYKKHQKMYKKVGYNKDSLGHIYADPDDPSKPKAYHQMVLETGFLVYFLINYYVELDTKEIDPDTRNEIEQIVDFQLESEKPDIWATLEQSFFGQLISLVYNLFQSILEFANEYRNKIQQKLLEQFKVGNGDREKLLLLKKKQMEKDFGESIQFFAKNSASIEVVRNGELEKIVFYKLSYCKYLPKETKTEFNEEVDRDSTNSKIQALVDFNQSIIEICEHEEFLAQFFNRNKFVAIFAKYVILWKDLCFLLTLWLNIMIVLSFYDDGIGDEDEQYYGRIHSPTFLQMLSKEQTQQIFFICGCCMMVCSTFVVSFFILKKGPLYVKEALNQSKDLIKKDQNVAVRLLLNLYLIGFCFIKVLLNIDMIYYLSYGILAFIATLYHPFFFAFHLSEIVLRYPTLRNIIRSFWEPKLALGLTFVLVLLMNYYFTILAYVFLYDTYPFHRCYNMLVCFMATFDYGFKNNGGIGGWTDGYNAQMPSNYNYGRFIWDNLNNILIQMISIQIFSGVIIDTFGDLREQEMNKNDDKSNICFICGLDRELFDRKSDEGFKNHIKHEHYLWNYAFYMAYLTNKKKSEYNGIETYIYNKIQNQDNSWFPINQSITASKENENNEISYEDKLQAAQERINKLKTMSMKVATLLEDVE